MSDIKIKNQKIIKVGNSYALTLDKEFIDQSELKVGEPMVAYYAVSSKKVTFANKPKTTASHTKDTKEEKFGAGVTPELRAWTKKFLEEDKEAMEALANL